MTLVWQAVGRVPVDFQGAGGLDGTPFGPGNHAQVIAVAHHLDQVFDVRYRTFVDVGDAGPNARRVDAAPVQHVWQPQVLDVARLAVHLVRQIESRNALADNRIQRRVLQHRVLRHTEVE